MGWDLGVNTAVWTGNAKASLDSKCKSNILASNLNFLHCKSIYILYERSYTDVLSFQIQNSRKIGPRLLVVQDSTCSVSTSTSTTSTTSRPIHFTTMILNRKTSFDWQDSLFNKNLNSKCVAPLSPSQQHVQNRCVKLIPVMDKAVLK